MKKKHNPMSSETKAKISAALKGRVSSWEHIRALADAKRGVKRSLETIAKISASRKGKRCSVKTEFKKGLTPWNKGRVGIDKFRRGSIVGATGGYLQIRLPDHPMANNEGYILLHRFILFIYLGRIISTDEIVHHIDGNKRNNRFDNLKICSRSEHMKIHEVGQ